MKLEDYKTLLEGIVHKTLYECSTLNEKDNNIIEEINDYLRNSSSFIDDLRFIISSKNNENYFAYYPFISTFLIKIPLKIKLDILNNHLLYEDIMMDNSLYIDVWNSIRIEDKIKYLNEKKKFSDIDYVLINHSLIDNGKFKINKVLKEIIHNTKIQAKIRDHSLNLSYSYSLLSSINVTDYKLCRLFKRESYTKLLLKKYKTFNEFKTLIEANKKIYRLIANNSLIFDSSDNENIYKYLLKNHNYIGKFDAKYADLFSIMEIASIIEDSTLDSYTFSVILQKLYHFNKEKANKLFSIDNLKKCARHSISINPFNDLNEKNKKDILNNYAIFSRFVDTIMIEVINDSYSEDDVLNALRNDEFISDMSPYALELLLNKISFKSSFNMLQNQSIFNKINNLNLRIDEKDQVFFSGFLDSPILLHKSEHSMIYNMLSLLNKDDLLYYITLPYVSGQISNCEIVTLLNKNEISLLDIIDSKELTNRLNTTDIINIIDESFRKNPDLSIFKDKKIFQLIFDIDDKTWNLLNIDEINYLYENIRMKSILSKRESVPTILSYKAVIASYLVFGLEGTLEIVDNGNRDITLDDVRNLQNEVVNERMLLFRENNSNIFQNINKRITSNIEKIGYIDSINDLAIQAKKNTFLDNLIYMMLESDFDSYNNIIEKLYNYTRTYKADEYKAKQVIYDYCKDFVSLYLKNKQEEFNNDFEKVILKNFTPKDSVLYNKRKEVGRNYLDKLKFKLFVNTLKDYDKEKYKIYYNENFDVDDITNKYKKYLAKEDVQFDEILRHVLIPIMNERFDKDNCLNKLGINKPEGTEKYLKHLADLKNVDFINKKIAKYKSKYDIKQIKELMDCICFNSELSFKITNNKRKELGYLNSLVRGLHGEVVINNDLLFEYKDDIDLYNLNDVLEYVKYLDILDNIVEKTKKFINKFMDEEKVKCYHAHEYYKAVDNYNFVFPINNRYYELKKHVLSLEDLEKVFNGFDLTNNDYDYQSLYEFLINKKNLIMVIDGYYEGIVEALGIIISKWNVILKRVEKNATLITLYNTLQSLDNNSYDVIKSLDRLIIEDLYKDGYYEEKDPDKRIEILSELFINGHHRVTSSIPYLSYRNEQYRIETLDNYNQDTYRSFNDSVYRVGAVGNDLLHYSILDKNGVQIGIYENEVLTNKIIGVRNGNTLYLNVLEGKKDINHHSLLHLFAREIIKLSKESKEKIDFVTIVNNDIYTSRSGTIVDSTICDAINSPIDLSTVDYLEFSKNNNLINLNNLHTNYNDNISTLLASDKVIDRASFKYYSPTDCYKRIRKSIIKLSNNIGEVYQAQINTILALYKLEYPNAKIVNENIMDTIYLGDDFVLFIDDKGNYYEYILPYDERAKEEVSSIKERLEKN